MNARILLIPILFAVASPVLADGLTPEHVARMRMVTDVAIAPDGARVAYRVAVPRTPFAQDDGAAYGELHVVDARGASRPFVTGRTAVQQVTWMPGGTSLAFLDRRGDDRHAALYTIPLAGGEARRALRLDTAIAGYAVAPDGRRVAVLARPAESDDARRLREAGFSQKVHEEDWLDTGLWLAELGRGTAAPRRIAIEGTVHQARWSPDGRRLALAVAPTPSVDDAYMQTRVRVLDVESGEVVARIDNPGKLGAIAWSPDGSHIALLAGEDDSDPREGRLMVAPASGGPVVDVLPDLQGHVWDYAWVDANTLAFIAMEGVESRVGTVRRDGRNARTLTRGGPVFTQLSVARNGDIALNGSTAAHPTEAFLLPRGANAPRRLTDTNPWLADLRLGQQEVVRYTARDGLELQGLLIRPLDERRGERYPLIVQVHGGPEAHYSNGWLTHYNLPGQVAAARGFAVFYPNYRASTGRGVAFSKLDHEDPAGKEFDDLVDGVDHLIEAGLVDRERVGITGGSYGGYATAWASTFHSERFAAGVMAVGISDATMMLALGDIPNEMYQVHLRVWPWENWDLYRERSPLYHVGKSRTPLLIMHGEADTRVHPAHSLALYRMLKLHGNAPVRLVLYPGEGHGNQRAASRYDFSLRQLRWFEHYLNGEGGEPPPYPVDYSAIRGTDG